MPEVPLVLGVYWDLWRGLEQFGGSLVSLPYSAAQAVSWMCEYGPKRLTAYRLSNTQFPVLHEKVGDLHNHRVVTMFHIVHTLNGKRWQTKFMTEGLELATIFKRDHRLLLSPR